MPLKGTQIPGERLAFVAYKYGQIPVKELETCLAIGFGESNWYDKAYNFNDTTGDRSFGIWQVNLLGKLKAQRMKDFQLTKEEDLYDLVTQARCMGIIYREALSWGRPSGWTPWGAYTNGSYAQHRALAQRGVTLFKQRLAESGDRLHVGGENDCDRI